MWNMVTVATCAVYIAVMASSVSAKPEATECTKVEFRDPLGIERCLGASVNVCNLTKSEQETEAHKIAKCFTRSRGMPNFVLWILSGMREGVLFALHLASPNGAQLLHPLLNLLTTAIREEYVEGRILPQFCERKISVSFPKAHNLAQCTNGIEYICYNWRHLQTTEFFTLLMSSVVCVFKKFPQFNILDLLREVNCLVLKALVNTLKRRQIFSPLLPTLEMLQLVLRCKVHEVFNEKAERRLLDPLSYEAH